MCVCVCVCVCVCARLRNLNVYVCKFWQCLSSGGSIPSFSEHSVCLRNLLFCLRSLSMSCVPLYCISLQVYSFFSVVLQPKLGLSRLVLDTLTRYDSSERVISSSLRPPPTQHPTSTMYEHSCPQRDSNPQ